MITDKTKIINNAGFNLFGYIIPLIFALVCIPQIINGLGNEKFGILSLIWIVIGYFSFLDLGIGRALTKVVSEKIAQNKSSEIPVIFWTSIIIMLFVSVVLTILSLLFIPSQLNNFLSIKEELKPETYKAFYLVLLSIPIVSTTAGLRGFLEAFQSFFYVNVMKIILGIFTFLGPLIILQFSDSLIYIVILLLIVRLLVWASYFIFCLKKDPILIQKIEFNLNAIKPSLKFSIWISLSNIIGPIILYSDRFLVGAQISLTAITYYSTPYEMVTKLLVIPTALMGVLFPFLSGSYILNIDLTLKYIKKTSKFVYLIIFPIILLIVSFAYEIMSIWLGKDFALNSYFVLQYLAVGIFMNSLSMIPNVFFQSIGKPKIPTLINLIELPIYLTLMWLSIKYLGIKGAAITYMIMAVIDTFLMYILGFKASRLKIFSRTDTYILLSSILILLFASNLQELISRIIYSLLILYLLLIAIMKYFLVAEEKELVNKLIHKLLFSFKR